jgi:hypothetical protein
MKKSSLILCIIFSPFLVKGQDCPDFINLMKEGINAKDYELAYRKFDSAEEVACTQEQRKEAKRYKSELFQKINGLREKAERAESEAKQQTNIAIKATNTIEQERQKVEQERQKAEFEKDNAVKALELVKVMSDSVSQATKLSLIAKEKVSLLIQLNDDEKLGDIQMDSLSYQKSIFYYSRAITKLEKSEIQDSVLLTKKLLITQKLKEAEKKYNIQNTFYMQMRIGDTLVERGVNYWARAKKLANTNLTNHNALVEQAVFNWSGAQSAYLSGMGYEYGRDTLLKKLTLVESYYGKKAKPVRKIKGDKYNEIMNLSISANLFIEKEEIAKRRVRQVLRRHPSDYSFITDNKMIDYAKKHNRSFGKSLSFYIGAGKMIGENPPLVKIGTKNVNAYFYSDEEGATINNSNMWVIGLTSNLNDHFDVGLEYGQYKQIPFSLYGDVAAINVYNNRGFDYYDDEPKIKSLSAYLGYYLLKVRNNKWKTSLCPITIQGLIGINWLQKSDYELDFRHVNENNLTFPSSLGEANGFSAIDYALTNDASANLSYSSEYKSISIYIFDESFEGWISGDDRKNLLNLFIGPRFTFFPMKKLHPLGFYTELIQNIPLARRVSFNLADVALQYVDQNYDNTPAEVSEFFYQNYNYDIEYKYAKYKFTSGWSIKLGVVYKL